LILGLDIADDIVEFGRLLLQTVLVGFLQVLDDFIVVFIFFSDLSSESFLSS